MKGLALAFVGLACVGCTTTYRTAQGTEFHEATIPTTTPDQRLNEATRTLLANGAVDLACPVERLRARSVTLARESVYLVEGCGWRATYVRDCRPDPKASQGHLSQNTGNRSEDPAEIVCQLEIIGQGGATSASSCLRPDTIGRASSQPTIAMTDLVSGNPMP